VPASAAPSAAKDQKIFNFALLLEYLQAAFYSEAVDRGRLKGGMRFTSWVRTATSANHFDVCRPNTLGLTGG